MSKGISYNCIIVDDDEIDRLMTLAFVRNYAFLEVKGVYDNAVAALAAIDETKPAVLFLDIDMEGTNGFELRRQLRQVEACIFISSFAEYALEGFELAALDYLLKPLRADRFSASMDRLEQYLELKKKSDLLDHSLQGDTIYIKDGHKHIKIRTADIWYLEALKDYTRIVTPERKYAVLASLGKLLETPAFKSFIRVHRSYAVQQHFIDSMTAQSLFIHDIALPIGRTYKKDLQEFILTSSD